MLWERRPRRDHATGLIAARAPLPQVIPDRLRENYKPVGWGDAGTPTLIPDRKMLGFVPYPNLRAPAEVHARSGTPEPEYPGSLTAGGHLNFIENLGRVNFPVMRTL